LESEQIVWGEKKETKRDWARVWATQSDTQMIARFASALPLST